MGIDCKRFTIQPVNKDFVCSICEDVFENPVERKACQHIYCHECITRWLLYNPTCPIDRQRLTHIELEDVPRVFKSLLGSLQLRCSFAEKGCSQSVSLESATSHENECPYGPKPSAVCPNDCGFTNTPGTPSDHSCLEVLKKTVNLQQCTIRTQKSQIDHYRREIGRLEGQIGRQRVPLMAVPRPQSPQSNVSNANAATIHKEGVERLWKKGVIKSKVVFEAMMTYNLVHFYGENAFKDSWGYGHAKNLEALVPHLTPALTKVLVNNNFSGYFQACLSNILGSNCKIFTIMNESTNGIQLLRSHYHNVLTSNRVVPINATDAPNESNYSMIIDFSKGKFNVGAFDRLAAEGSFIINPWSPHELRQRVNNEIRHVTFHSFFGEKKYRYSNHGSTRPLT